MGRESLRSRERRATYSAIRAGTLQRQLPTDREVDVFFRAIDHKDVNAFGVRTLANFDLDTLYPMPPMHTRPGSNNAGFEPRVTILGYAAWRRRHDIVKHLLIAGAAPTLSDRRPVGAIDTEVEETQLRELLSRRHGVGLVSAAATYVVECVARMRCFADRKSVV